MRTVLVPLDGSQATEHVLPYASALAAMLDATIHIVLVVTQVHYDHRLPARHAPGLSEHVPTEDSLRAWAHQTTSFSQATANAKRYLARVTAPLQHEGHHVTTHVLFGDPLSNIVHLAQTLPSTLLALAQHDKPGPGGWTVSGLAPTIARLTTQSLFAVRIKGRAYPLKVLDMQRVLVALDGSARAEHALKLAANLAHSNQAALHMLHVLDHYDGPAPDALLPGSHTMPGRTLSIPLGADHAPSRFTQGLGAAQVYLRNAAETVHHTHIPTAAHLATGLPAARIATTASAQQSDLIVLTRRGAGQRHQQTLGTTASQVLHISTTPLMIIPSDDVTPDTR